MNVKGTSAGKAEIILKKDSSLNSTDGFSGATAFLSFKSTWSKDQWL